MSNMCIGPAAMGCGACKRLNFVCALQEIKEYLCMTCCFPMWTGTLQHVFINFQCNFIGAAHDTLWPSPLSAGCFFMFSVMFSMPERIPVTQLELSCLPHIPFTVPYTCCCGPQQAKCGTMGIYASSRCAEPVSPRKKQAADKLFAIVQIMLSVLARRYDWQVDLTAPIREFLLTLPRHGLPMTFNKLDHPLARKSDE